MFILENNIKLRNAIRIIGYDTFDFCIYILLFPLKENRNDFEIIKIFTMKSDYLKMIKVMQEIKS